MQLDGVLLRRCRSGCRAGSSQERLQAFSAFHFSSQFRMESRGNDYTERRGLGVIAIEGAQNPNASVQTRLQFAMIEWLADVFIGAGFNASGYIVGLVLAAEQKNVSVRRRRQIPNPSA